MHSEVKAEAPRRWRIVLGIIACNWIAIVFGLVEFLLPISIVLAFVLMARWRSRMPVMILVLNPLVIGFGTGVADYFSTRPRTQGMGLPGEQFFNLDPDTRCYRQTGGCVVRGGEWVRHSPHNFGLNLMVALFGKPPKTYAGAYPSKNEVLKITDSAPPTPLTEFRKGNVIADGATIGLGEKVTEQICSDLSVFLNLDDETTKTSVRAVVYKEDCLVVRVKTTTDEALGGSWDVDGAFLFDTRTLKPFARYHYVGQMNRIPRLLMR